MRFIVMHKVDADMEAGSPPNQAIVSSMGQLVQESLKSGIFKNGAGLHRTEKRVRLDFKGGKAKVTKGPFSGGNQLVASVFMVRTTDIEAAGEQAARIAALLGDVEIEIGPVVEPWDLGFMPKPADITSERFLLLVKSDAASERGERDAHKRAALKELERKMTDEGVLLSTEHLLPSSRGARLPAGKRGKQAWVDGPFAESKELVAGFSILDLPTRADAFAWADRYAAILDKNEVDVRELEEPS